MSDATPPEPSDPPERIETKVEANTESQIEPQAAGKAPSGKPRFRVARFLSWTSAVSVLILAALLAGLYYAAGSPAFEEYVRRRLVAALADATGGRVEIAGFHWDLLHLSMDADGITIHGLEAANEVPYAHVDRLHLGIRLAGLLVPHFHPTVDLADLELTGPVAHLIVYPDGSTNQPKPRIARKPGKSGVDTLFDLKAGHVSVAHGLLLAQNQAIPLDFEAGDIDLRLKYVAAGPQPAKPALADAAPANAEKYRIELALGSLRLARGRMMPDPVCPDLVQTAIREPLEGRIEASADLFRNAALLNSLSLRSELPLGTRIKNALLRHPDAQHLLEIRGSLSDFANPRWQARLTGDLDLRALAPLTGFPCVRQGVGELDLKATGAAGQFAVDGRANVAHVAYRQVGVDFTGARATTVLHVDPQQIVFSEVRAFPIQGGEIDGVFRIQNYLPAPASKTVSPATVSSAAPAASSRPSFAGRVRALLPSLHARAKPTVAGRNPALAPRKAAPFTGSFQGVVRGISLDTVMDDDGPPGFQRLGFNTAATGQVSCGWVGDPSKTFRGDAKVTLGPLAKAPAGEIPASGDFDAGYIQATGSVEVRSLHLRTPASTLVAGGSLGVYPLTRDSVLAFQFHTGNLGEFDTVLRTSGVRNGKASGLAALPIAVSGQADFTGTLSDTLPDPKLDGHLQVTRLSMDLPAMGLAANHPSTNIQATAPLAASTAMVSPKAVALPAPSHSVTWDAISLTGSYSSRHIQIAEGEMRHGAASILVSGTLDAALKSTPHLGAQPEFDQFSVLHATASVDRVSVADILPFTGSDLPLSGLLSLKANMAGPLQTLAGSGWADLTDAKWNGLSVKRVHAEAGVAGRVVRVATFTLDQGTGQATGPGQAGGRLTGSGTYDLDRKTFTANALGAGFDVAQLLSSAQPATPVGGKLNFTVTGSGTLDDPRLEARADLAGLSIGGDAFGAIVAEARSQNRKLTYQVNSTQQAAELKITGVTTLAGDYPTQAHLDFSRLNVGALLTLAHVSGINGESAMSGSAQVSGPLAHLAQLSGSATLQDPALQVQGVHLHSDGPLRASLANGVVHIDPLRITGENTNVNVSGTLGIAGSRQLDLFANGSVNLVLAETLDRDLTASGVAKFQMEAHGQLANPGLRGTVQFQNASLALGDIPNGLSQINGMLEFNQNRLEVRSLTAMSGGGQLSVAGYLAYQHGLYADLSVTGKSIRIRYPQGVSSLADAGLRLQGPQNNLLLSGEVQITRFSINDDLDIGALVAQANRVSPLPPPDAASNHIRLDVHLTTAPDMNFQNAYAKLAGDADLRLRGTVASPSLLGRIAITEGEATLAGTKYTLERGDIFFSNPVRIEPTIDLDASATVEDYDITIGLHGNADKLAVTYRSEPPLPQADVIALLALGRTQEEQSIYTQEQQQAGVNPATDALLGGALNATVSNRIQKLFGAGSVKIDPNYIGTLGNSTVRITMTERFGRNVTLTYASNVNTSTETLIQAEVAINRHVSVLVGQDESGVFSVVVKARRRYR